MKGPRGQDAVCKESPGTSCKPPYWGQGGGIFKGEKGEPGTYV